MADSVGGVSQSEGWGREGDVHHHPVIAMEPDRYYPLKLALWRGFRQIGEVAMDPTKLQQACSTSIPARIARSEDTGHGESSRRWLGGAGASRRTSVASSIDGTEPP
jgi:hypothetical protein